MRRMPVRLSAVALIALLVIAFFWLEGPSQLSLEALKTRRSELVGLYQHHPAEMVAVFCAVYVLITGFSLPGAALLTLAAGAIFGLLAGVVVVSIASTVGATIAFLSSRFIFRDWVRKRYGAQVSRMDRGVERDGALYLLGLRLIPAVPFFLLNLVMGMTAMRPRTFVWASQLGMLPATLVFVNAGTQIATLTSPADVLSPSILCSLAMLGLFPIAAARVLEWMRRVRLYRRWPQPARFDRNLVVIGGGSAGLVSAYVAAGSGAAVTLVERERMGGDCLNTGCVPSKALIATTRVIAQIRNAKAYGLAAADVKFEFSEIMARVRHVIERIRPHDSVERYSALGVECLAGEARLVSPWEVEVRAENGNVRRISTRAVIIATGARPSVPDIPGLADLGFFTSDTIWDLRVLPRRLLVLGGGPIGCELAQAFARLGSEVTIVERGPQLLPREDVDVAREIERRFDNEGIRVHLGHFAARCAISDGEKKLIAFRDGSEITFLYDALLCAVGRTPRVSGFGLEELGIDLTGSGAVATNEFLQTRYPNVLACGDVAGPYQFTHSASHQAWCAAMNALFGGLRRMRADYSVMPWATFVEPEVARVGLNEREAAERGLACDVTRYDLSELDRAIVDETAQGFVKVLTEPGGGTVLGATVVGERAGELIGEYVAAMRHGTGLSGILRTIHVYPTYAEAAKLLAGRWRAARVPGWLLRWVGKYHGWRRG